MEGGPFCGRVCVTPLGDEYEVLRREMTSLGEKIRMVLLTIMKHSRVLTQRSLFS